MPQRDRGRAVIALDPATGELLWIHGEHEGKRGAPLPGSFCLRPRPRVLVRRPGRANLLCDSGAFVSFAWTQKPACAFLLLEITAKWIEAE